MGIPVMCNCANNKGGLCMGKASMAEIHSVMANKQGYKECPGYIPIGDPAYEGELQGPRKLGKDGQTEVFEE
jgi:hypothetical protein